MADYSRDQDIGKTTEETHKTEVQNLDIITEVIQEDTNVAEQTLGELKRVRRGTEVLIDQDIDEKVD